MLYLIPLTPPHPTNPLLTHLPPLDKMVAILADDIF